MSRLSRLGFIDTHRTLDPVRRRVRSRGVPPALNDHEVFYCEHLGEASDLLGKVFAPNHLTTSDEDGFAAALHGVRLRDLSLLYLDLHVAATLDVPHSGGYYAVHMPMNGRAVGCVGGHDVEANTIRAVVTNPSDPVLLWLDHDSPQLIVRIQASALERYLTRLIGRTLDHRLTFEPGLDLTSDAANRWHGAVQLLHTEVFYSGSLLHAGIGVGALEEFLMSSLLMVQPSNYRDVLNGPAGRPARRVVRRALDYIEGHLSEPLTMAKIAQFADGSVRSVQQGFHDELGVTPMAYLRDRRLERARAELVDATPQDGVTVTSVAEHWGFHHLGSFAVLYRKRWGESPSQTLRR